ncbi:MAG: adenine phosphoribosyltransferase [Elusimicrobiales bacterium]
MITVTEDEIKKFIRDVPDFPKPGILFRDITPFLENPDIFKKTIKQLAERYKNESIKKVVGIEARGFIIASPIALEINAGFVPVRKKGKLPYKTESVTYQLEYGTDTLQIHSDAIKKGEKVLIVDDVIATGGTAKAVCELVERLGGTIHEIFMLIELTALGGREMLSGYRFHSLVKY